MINAPSPSGPTAFGHTLTGERVDRITLSDGQLTVCLLALGVTLQGLWLTGVPHSLTLGCGTVAAYQTAGSYLGALVGPVANRIGGAEATINDRCCQFAANEGTNTLHSGPDGLHNRIWHLADYDATAATFTLSLPAGDSGFPGNRRISARYSLHPNATLRLEISVITDALTPISIADHSYWNLDGTGDWSGHSLQIAADHWLPVTVQGLPTGARMPTIAEMNFAQSRTIQPGSPALDHNFCLANARRPLTFTARLTGASGVTLALSTTEPGLQIYDGRSPIRPGDVPYAGLALEPQGWPDALHQPSFPSILASPASPYHQTTQWQFSRT